MAMALVLDNAALHKHKIVQVYVACENMTNFLEEHAIIIILLKTFKI